jgi:hypothetical protein
MSDTRPSEMRLDLRVDRSHTPITGTLGVAGQAAVGFTGWLELTAALQTAIEPPTDAAQPEAR